QNVGIYDDYERNLPPLDQYKSDDIESLDPSEVPGLEKTRREAPEPKVLNLQVIRPSGVASAWQPPLSILGDDLGKLVSNPESGIRLEDMQSEIQNKVNDGAQIYQSLTNGAIDKLTDKQATDLIWYLQASAEAKTDVAGAPETAYTLPDPNGHVLKSLDGTVSGAQGLAYQRNSSHLEDFQRVRDGSGAARGINLRPDSGNPKNTDTLLPYAKQTILYQKLSAGTRDYPQDRVFIKPEDHGMYKSDPKVFDKNGPSRGSLEHDKRDAVAHSAGFLGSSYRKLTGGNSPAGSNKERIPPEMAKDYNAIIKAAAKVKSAKEILGANNPTDNSGGLRVMNDNIQKLKTHLGDKPVPGLAKATGAFHDKYLKNPRYDHLDLRFGQEVIF
ncbi:MAG: hypothetical protein AAFY56_08800, partial [Pseudomonadota bacterium]